MLIDPDQGDEHRQPEQHVEEPHDFVDLLFAFFAQFALVQHFGGREGAFGAER